MKELVIYHAHCPDGFAGAWLFHLAYPDAEFVPASYGDAPPDVRGKSVHLVDFSYRGPVLAQLFSDCGGNLVVLDHHKSAIPDLAAIPEENVLFDLEESGGMIAWKYLWDNALLPEEYMSQYSRFQAPWVIHYTQDRDLWRHELNMSREVNAALHSFEFDFADWDCRAHWEYHRRNGQTFPGPEIMDFAREGAAILRYQAKVVAQHVARAREANWGGHLVLQVNATTLVSEIGGELAKGRPFAMTYQDLAGGKRQFSLRSDEHGLDVGEIAREQGGGGHRHAAGLVI